MVSTSARRTGDQGEEAAARLLRSRGLRILDRNWRAGPLELDMVCADGDTLVFVEVKTRAANGMTSPADGITARKRRLLFQAARAWLGAHAAWDRPCRFDVVCVIRDGALFTPEHCPHAFDISEFVDCRHTAWQPW